MNNDYHFDRAYSLYSAGQYPAAIELLKELLADDPNDALAHGLLSACLLDSKRLHAAKYEISTALQLEPNIPFLLLIKGQIAVYENQPKEALQDCDEALALDPEFVEALLLKSSTHALLDNPTKQLSYIQQALTLQPDSADVITTLGEYYFATGKLQKAEEAAKDALAISPENDDANLLMGNIQLAMGNMEEAEYHAKFVIMHNPESDAALTLFSNIKARQNWFLGIWWRLNSKISKVGNLKASLYLVLGYLLFTLLAQIFKDLGYDGISKITSFAWLALVVYSWVGIPFYYKQLNKELEKFQFNKDY